MKLSEDWEILLKQAELLGFAVERWHDGTVRVGKEGAWADFFVIEDVPAEELQEEFVEYMREMTDEAGL